VNALLAVLVLAQQTAAPAVVPVPSSDAVLDRPVTLAFRNVTLAEALARLRHEHGAPLAWSGDVLPAGHRVTLSLRGSSLGAALAAILEGSGLDVLVTGQGTVVIVPRRPGARSPGPIPESVAAARLATGVRELDQVVVIGSPVAAAPEREQPVAISVLGRGALAEAAHGRTADLVRTLLPGIVLWDRGPGGPPARIAAVRGVSSFTTRGVKTYVDGIEQASPDLFTLLDGRTIERIEVIRGPQGAALYGPDALNGIVQIVTRKGQPGATGFRGRGVTSAGPYERHDLDRPSLWQEHSAGVTGAAATASFDAGVALGRVGQAHGTPWLRTRAAAAGGRALVGPLALEASVRDGSHEFVDEFGSGARHELEERGGGITALHAISTRWRHTLAAGHHRHSGPRERSVPTQLTPSLPLGATHETATRTSLRYSLAHDLALDPHEVTLSWGTEYAHSRVERSVRSVVASRLSTLYDDDQRSTGTFGQARVRLFDRLVATAGLRAEWVSSVGENRGGPTWASATGLSWSHAAGRTTLRFRTAWGRGIRPPEPGMRRDMATATVTQQGNPDLGPEVQTGLELGLDAYFADRAWARVTWYEQRAQDLIQQVNVRAPGAATRTYQFQNVGAIGNRGAELEAGTRLGPVTLNGLLYLNHSEVRQTSAAYTGELAPGDALPEVPAGVGAFSIRYQAGRLRAEAGLSWLGGWTGYDWEALAAAGRGEAPVRAQNREYWIRYPGVVRPWVALGTSLGAGLHAFARVDNPGNRAAVIRDNGAPPLGRTTVVGLELRP
jgi:outer membrane receptor protein involved in Fe transport